MSLFSLKAFLKEKSLFPDKGVEFGVQGLGFGVRLDYAADVFLQPLRRFVLVEGA